MEKIGTVMTIRAQEDRDHDYIFSFNRAKDFDSVYILKPIMQEDVTWLKKKTISLVYDNFDTTLTQWLVDNKFKSEGGSVSVDFLQIIRDILRGLCYLAKDGTYCETLSSKSVVIKNGRAKLVNIRAASGSTSVGGGGGTSAANSTDNAAFKSIIEDIFDQRNELVPYHLRKLIDFLPTDKKGQRRQRLLNIDSHPIFLGDKGKLLYIVQVTFMLEYESWKTRVFFGMLKHFKKSTTPSWLDILLKYNDPHLDGVKDKTREAYQVSSDEQTSSFLKFMRNVIVHLNEDIRLSHPNTETLYTYKEVAKLFDEMWPGFVHMVHELSNISGIYIIAFDDFLK